MRTLPALTIALSVLIPVLGFGCKKGGNSAPDAAASASARTAPTASSIPAPADVAAPPADAEKTASGLASKVLKPGTGDKKPQLQDSVKVHYTGWTTDGKMFDSSLTRGQPASFGLKGVIPGWTEGLQLMVIGEKRRLWIPEEMAYKGKPGRPQGMLVFDVELLEIKEGPKPIPAPPDVAAAPSDAQTTKSGLAFKVLEKGKGTKKPKEQDKVKVNFTGWTADGQMFDSSVARGQPANLQVDKLMPGWTEAVQLMVEGEKRRVWIPEALGFKGQPGAPKGALVMEIELLEITDGPKPIPAPADVAKPPADAKKTASGLYSKQLTKGKGTAHPAASSMVEVHYTGWTTNGKMFDSSVVSKQPAQFPLNHVIPGWTEGLQLMVEGEKRRLWIPEDLAYKGKPGAPAGMLVFDVELLKIIKP
ncbi:MAG: FKBP-type peptidyl-prolyl cis-trans isomerase [Deltaproteobacteria bacterium]|nr:FKBP-type peptidyl-prolyl cis-trans isomerase [Deltaproteobacteria bacterium]